jgi:uncharacterized protein (TIGR02271 family)
MPEQQIQQSSIIVTGENGLRGVIETMTHPWESPEPQALVRLDTGQKIVVPTGALRLQEDGSYRVPLSREDVEQHRSEQRGEDAVVIPVIVEELAVQKRTVETGRVRVTKTVHERQELVDEPLLEEKVVVERVPISRIVDAAPAVRQEGDVLVVPVLEEVLVVEKRLLLKEEIRITRTRVEAHHPQQVTLRSEEAVVERLPITQPSSTKERQE